LRNRIPGQHRLAKDDDAACDAAHPPTPPRHVVLLDKSCHLVNDGIHPGQLPRRKPLMPWPYFIPASIARPHEWLQCAAMHLFCDQLFCPIGLAPMNNAGILVDDSNATADLCRPRWNLAAPATHAPGLGLCIGPCLPGHRAGPIHFSGTWRPRNHG
jgi:hypothetical protein